MMDRTKLYVTVKGVEYQTGADQQLLRVGVIMDVQSTLVGGGYVETDVTWWHDQEPPDAMGPGTASVAIGFDCLSDAELRVVEEVARKELKARGYELPKLPEDPQS
jgi:hypothetical protein